jgi:hypothetical protein
MQDGQIPSELYFMCGFGMILSSAGESSGSGEINATMLKSHWADCIPHQGYKLMQYAETSSYMNHSVTV